MSASPSQLRITPFDASTSQAVGSPGVPGAGIASGGRGWVAITEAARLAKLSVGHLARQCRDKWEPMGLARRDAAGRWEISSNASPALANTQAMAGGDDALADMPAKAREEAIRRRSLVLAWREAVALADFHGTPQDSATDSYLASIGNAISRATLYNWDRKLRDHGIRGLVDMRGRKAIAEPGNDDPFMEEAKRLFLARNRHDKTTCYHMAVGRADQMGWKIPSYRSMCRYLDKIPAAVVTLHREGSKAFTDNHQPFIDRDYASLDANDVWVGDEHTFDVHVEIATSSGEVKTVRPTLTAWQDVRSRMIVGWRITSGSANSEVILQAFRQGCLAYGVPRNIYIDNGRDYGAKALHGDTKAQRRELRGSDRSQGANFRGLIDPQRAAGIFPALDIQCTFAEPYHGQSKPIERTFREVCRRFSRWFDTWCGGTPEEKPEGLNDRIKAGKAPTLAEFVDRFSYWLENDYHVMPHTGQAMRGRSPKVCFGEELRTKRTAKAELLDLLLLQRFGPRKVGQQGVNHKGIWYGKHDLIMHQGQDVYMRIDDRDLRSITIWTEADAFIAIAKANEALPFMADSQDLREALAEKRRVTKQVRDYHRVKPTLHETHEDRMRRMIAGKRKAAQMAGHVPVDPDKPPTHEASVMPIRTPIESQMNRLQQAIERDRMKAAAGAETSMNLIAAGSRFRTQEPQESNPTPQPSTLSRLAAAMKKETQ